MKSHALSVLFSSAPLHGNVWSQIGRAVGDPVMRSLRRAKILGGYRGLDITNGLGPQDDRLLAIAIAAWWIERGRKVFRFW